MKVVWQQKGVSRFWRYPPFGTTLALTMTFEFADLERHGGAHILRLGLVSSLTACPDLLGRLALYVPAQAPSARTTPC